MMGSPHATPMVIFSGWLQGFFPGIGHPLGHPDRCSGRSWCFAQHCQHAVSSEFSLGTASLEASRHHMHPALPVQWHTFLGPRGSQVMGILMLKLREFQENQDGFLGTLAHLVLETKAVLLLSTPSYRWGNRETSHAECSKLGKGRLEGQESEFRLLSFCKWPGRFEGRFCIWTQVVVRVLFSLIFIWKYD